MPPKVEADTKQKCNNKQFVNSGPSFPAIICQLYRGSRFKKDAVLHKLSHGRLNQNWKLCMEAECALRYIRAAEISGTIPGVHLCNWKQNAGICSPFGLNVR